MIEYALENFRSLLHTVTAVEARFEELTYDDILSVFGNTRITIERYIDMMIFSQQNRTYLKAGSHADTNA